MSIEATYHSEVRFVRSAHSSKTGTTITLALPDSDELSKVAGFDGKRYMLALVEIGDDEQPIQPSSTSSTSSTVAAVEKPKGGYASKWLALRCKEAKFQSWIRPIYDVMMGGRGVGWGDVGPDDFKEAATASVGTLELYAAHCVKVICSCEQSRREIDIDQAKLAAFHAKIRLPYMKWLATHGHTAPEVEHA